MKKINILFIMLSIISAQGFGIKGGVNLGKFVGDDIEEIADQLDEKYHIGYSGGVFFAMPIDPLEVRIEALYVQNGAKFELSEDGGEFSLSTNLNWIDVPVLVGLKFGGLRVFAGPYFDYFLGGKAKYEISYGDESFDEEEDIDSDEYKSINYGVIGGVAFGLGAMELEVRYSHGISTLDKEPDDWDENFDGKYEESDLKPTMIQAFLNFYLSK